MIENLDVGMRVTVPFGKTKIQTGIVLHIHEEKPAYDTKEIDQILDEIPVVNKHQLRHWFWLADYYMCSIGEVVRTGLPSAFLLESETLISKNKQEKQQKVELTDEEYLIVEALKDNLRFEYKSAIHT